MIDQSTRFGISSSTKRRARQLVMASVLAVVCGGCVQVAGAQPATPPITGVALERANALIASNKALAPDNQTPTSFQNVVSLADADVVAQAQTLSAQAGHDGLHYNYFLFLAAVNKVRATHADKLDIPANTYRIYEPTNMKSGTGIIDLVNLSHVVVDGHGSSLLFYFYGKAIAPLVGIHPRSSIRLSNSDHVTLRNLTIDFDEPIAAPITLHGTGAPGDPQMFTVDSTFPINPEAPIPFTVFEAYDRAHRGFGASRDLDPAQFAVWKKAWEPGGGYPHPCAPANPTGPAACFKYVSGQTYAFGPTEKFSPFPPKPNEFLAMVRDNNFAAVAVGEASSHLNIDGITIYGSPGGGIVLVTAGDAIRIANCVIRRKPDNLVHAGEWRRYVSSNSDGMDSISGQGDVVVENNIVGDQGDDGINIDAAFRAATATGPNVVDAWWPGLKDWYAVGATVNIYDNVAKNAIAMNVPIAATRPSTTPGHQMVVLGTVSPPLTPGTAYKILSNAWSSSNVIVRNNSYFNNRARGVVAHGSNVAVINNRFNGDTEAAIESVYDNRNGTPEGAPANNVVIAGNVITDVNSEWYDPTIVSIGMPAAIAVYSQARGLRTPNGGVQPGNLIARHVVISDNIVRDVSGAGILVSQSDDVVLARNQISGSNQHHFDMPLVDGHDVAIENVTRLKSDR